MTSRQCCERALGDRFGGYPCQRPATVERDGKWYCWQHDPERVAREKEKRHAQWDAKQTIEDRKWRRRAAERRACAKVPTEVLERISAPELLAACEMVIKAASPDGWAYLTSDELTQLKDALARARADSE